jgi:hypothetical protein
MKKILISLGVIGLIFTLAVGLLLPKYQEKAKATAAIAARMEEAKTAEERIRERLKDPDGATFRNTQTFDDGNACGEVNAKNGYGGFQGYSAWWISGGEAAIHKPEDSDIQTACAWAKDPEQRVRVLCGALASIAGIGKKYKVDDDGASAADLKKYNCKRFDTPKAAK